MARIERVAFFDGETALSATQRENLDKSSVDHAAMCPYWEQVDTIVRGAKAIRDAGEKYLPKFPNEPDTEYKFRLSLTKFTNIYRDVVEGLASKPFENEVATDETLGTLPEQLTDFIGNVDGANNNLTVFAAATFFNGINDAIDWIFVDYPKVPVSTAPRSIEEERKSGIRPFWSHVKAINVLEAQSAVIAGNEELTYMRIMEPGDPNHIRIMIRDELGARWELWEQDKSKLPTGVGQPTIWYQIDQGVFTIGVIPMVAFVTGRRNGRTWFVHPPMRDAADLQIELYLQESGLKWIKTLTAYPMLTGNGVKPDKNPDGTTKPVNVGPMRVLYAPTDGNGNVGSWELIEPSAQSLTFLQSDVEKTINQLRELGRNPLTAQSGNITVITAAVAGKKGNSAVQMWAFGLEDALDNALILTAMWYGLPRDEMVEKINTKVFTDFDVDGDNGAVAVTALKDARAAGDLSQRTLWKELKRRDILSPDFDPDDEEQAILDEGPTEDEGEVDPITGLPIKQVVPPVLPNAGA
jgi:hypothetical protein